MEPEHSRDPRCEHKRMRRCEYVEECADWVVGEQESTADIQERQKRQREAGHESCQQGPIACGHRRQSRTIHEAVVCRTRTCIFLQKNSGPAYCHTLSRIDMMQPRTSPLEPKRYIMNSGRSTKPGQQINIGKDSPEYRA